MEYEESLELKQLGFDEPCLGFYERNQELIIQECLITDFHGDSLQCVAPTYSQAFRWFREKYNMPSKTEATFESETPNQYHYFYQIITNDFIDGDGVMLKWTYEKAELECLKKLIEIVKNGK